MKNIFLQRVLFLGSMLLADACGGTLGGNPEVDTNAADTPGDVSTGLSFALTDAPISDAKNVFITVESVAVAKADGTWITIPLKNETEIDLLRLQGGLSTPLAEITSIAPGIYTQTRLLLSESAPSRLIDLSGVEHILKVPSGTESGLKIHQDIIVEAGKASVFTIDFDLRKSLKLNGNGNGNNSKYMLKPVLRLIEDAKSGSISGHGVTSSVLCLYEQGKVKDPDDSCENAVASTTINEGEFALKLIPAGTYEIRIFRNGAMISDTSPIVVNRGDEAIVAELP